MCFRPTSVDSGPIKCPQCGEEVSPMLSKCPYCGYTEKDVVASVAPKYDIPGMPKPPKAPGAPK